MRHISLNNLKYKRTELLAKIEQNRKVHEADYAEARAVYKNRLKEELTKRLTDLEMGLDVDAIFNLPKPVQYVREYKRAYEQLSMTTAEEIELDSITFAQLVLDEWSWKSDFENLTKSYQAAATNRF